MTMATEKPAQEMDLQKNRPVEPRKSDLSELAEREKKIIQEEERARDRGGEDHPVPTPQRHPAPLHYEQAERLKKCVDDLHVWINVAESVLPRSGKRAREFALARTYLEDAGMRMQRAVLMKDE
jgi:hypothetical protein